MITHIWCKFIPVAFETFEYSDLTMKLFIFTIFFALFALVQCQGALPGELQQIIEFLSV